MGRGQGEAFLEAGVVIHVLGDRVQCPEGGRKALAWVSRDQDTEGTRALESAQLCHLTFASLDWAVV